MPPPSRDFVRALRALQIQNTGRWGLHLALVFFLSTLWLAWAAGSRVNVYATSESARLEVREGAFPIVASLDGTVTRVNLAIGRSVTRGDVLVQLKDDGTLMRLEEERAHLRGMNGRRSNLQAERSRLEQMELEQASGFNEATSVSTEEVAAAEAAYQAVRKSHDRSLRLNQEGLISNADLDRLSGEVEEARARLEAAKSQARRSWWEGRADASARRARLAQVDGEQAHIGAEISALEAAGQRLSEEVSQYALRAPVDGTIAESLQLNTGAFVEAGTILGTVVSNGSLRVTGEFETASALGRVKEGQSARIRLEGFPWQLYGDLRGTVSHVASESRNGTIRVELDLDAQSNEGLLTRHGLPAAVDVCVERASPIALFLRMAGFTHAQSKQRPKTPSGVGDDR